MIKIKQTEDKELLFEILKQLKEHNGHCPCQFDESKDTLCICASFKKEIDKTNLGTIECLCGRYVATITQD